MPRNTKKRKRKERKSSNKKRKLEVLKRPKSSYFLFMDDHRKDLMADDNFKKDGKAEGTRVCDISKLSKEMGRMWKALTEEEQAPYKEKAMELKKKYQEELEKRKNDSTSESESESD